MDWVGKRCRASKLKRFPCVYPLDRMGRDLQEGWRIKRHAYIGVGRAEFANIAPRLKSSSMTNDSSRWDPLDGGNTGAIMFRSPVSRENTWHGNGETLGFDRCYNLFNPFATTIVAPHKMPRIERLELHRVSFSGNDSVDILSLSSIFFSYINTVKANSNLRGTSHSAKGLKERKCKRVGRQIFGKVV